MQIEKAEEFVAEFLQSGLSPLLMYHNYSHTHDVMLAAMTIAKEEGVVSENDLALLRTAALFHDCGYVSGYENHEAEGCLLVQKFLPGFGYSGQQINTICSLIMKTKLPSKPETILEKILCDADLDYLGRDDFAVLGAKLYLELHNLKKVKDEKEWDEMQVKFLESHHYWTKSANEK